MALRLTPVSTASQVPLAWLREVFRSYGSGRSYPADFVYRDDAEMRRRFIASNALDDGPARHFIADVDGAAAGFCSLVYDASDNAVIENAVLLPVFRSRGLGRELFTAAAAAARLQGARRFIASVYPQEASPSLRVCRKMGMREQYAKYRARSDSPATEDPAVGPRPSVVGFTTYRCVHYLAWRALQVAEPGKDAPRVPVGPAISDLLWPMQGATPPQPWRREPRIVLSLSVDEALEASP